MGRQKRCCSLDEYTRTIHRNARWVRSMGHIFVLRKVDVQYLETKCKETEKICLFYNLDDDR